MLRLVSTHPLLALALLSFIAIIAITPVSALTGDTFTVNCQPLTLQRADPIVYPGIASAHVHAVVGGNNFQRTMNGMYDARNANVTTCDKSTDHSNYWVPMLYYYRTSTKMFELVNWKGSAAYYQKRACNYQPGLQRCDFTTFVPLAPPDGLRMLAGNPFRRTYNDSSFADRAVSFMCLYNGGSMYYNGFPTQPCTYLLRAQVYFPSCWDGKNTDSADHMSHMAYPAIGDYNGGVCPASHPVAIMSVFYEFDFDTSPYGNDISHYALACGDVTGYGFHGDYIMGWTNRTALQNAHRDCVGESDCPTLGNQQPQRRTLIVPAIYPEQIGLNGPIPLLPGNNPVVFKETAPIIHHNNKPVNINN